MAAKGKKEVYVVVKDEEHWNSLINENSKKLSVVDAHVSWTGPTEMMLPTWKTITNGLEEWETRLEFLLLDLDKVPIKIPGKSGFVAGAKPKFFYFLEGQLKDETNGVNIPEMQEKIMKYVPSL